MAKQNWKCFAIHCQYMKPQSARGITKLLIPDPNQANQWHAFIKPHAIENNLIQYCQNHFQTPQSTPYTVPPLEPLLNYNSLTPFGAQILQGTAELDDLPISAHAKLLLQHQKPGYLLIIHDSKLCHLKLCWMDSASGQSIPPLLPLAIILEFTNLWPKTPTDLQNNAKETTNNQGDGQTNQDPIRI